MESPSAQLIEPTMLDVGVDGPPSSPFVTEVDNQSRAASKQYAYPQPDAMKVHDLCEDKENVPQEIGTPSKSNSSPKKPSTPEPAAIDETVLAGEERPSSSSADWNLMPPPSTRKVSGSPKKTPLKPSRSGAHTPQSASRSNSFKRTHTQNASLFQAGLDQRNTTMPNEDQMSVDDTCFSTFSEIPEMTVFAKLGQSPTRHGDVLRTTGRATEATPRTSRKRSSPSRSPSPTPRRQKMPAMGKQDETTSFLIDFTQQIEGATGSRAASPTKSSTESNLLQYIHNQRSPTKSTSRPNYCTPSKPNHLLNLLDFELPPAPTPRSVPTITVRELESLKSSYLSQISSLKATLSGREAEVDSLKKAVNDAERRVGEAQETLREERSQREHAEQEKVGWEKRGKEFESVLKSVKEEIIRSEAEKEDVAHRLEETEKRAGEAEMRAVKAEERFADALAARASGAEGGDGADGGMEEQVQRLVAAQIDAKIEAVSRELHSVYKEKHERKVGTLKKSYEARNEKKTSELQARVDSLEKRNEELQAARDSTFSGPVPSNISMIGSDSNAELKAQIEEQKAYLARLEIEMQTSNQQQDQLMRELQQERIEKGDLVAAVDEMLALQAEAPPTPGGARAMSVVEDFRKSISRPPSGLRAPAPSAMGGGGAESKIGRGIPAPGAGLNRSTSGGAGKSRILANIERMGRTGSSQGNHGGFE